MKKLFISQPMRHLSDAEIKATREKAIESAKLILGEDVEVLDSYVPNPPEGNPGLGYLAKSLEYLAKADVAFFCKGWEEARGCKIEHSCALEYGVVIIEDHTSEGQTFTKEDYEAAVMKARDEMFDDPELSGFSKAVLPLMLLIVAKKISNNLFTKEDK